jgi:hypothetical protein
VRDGGVPARVIETIEPPRPLDDLADLMWDALTAATGRDGRPRAEVLAGGLTRVAFDDRALVVNSSQNGGAEDTWVLRR